MSVTRHGPDPRDLPGRRRQRGSRRVPGGRNQGGAWPRGIVRFGSEYLPAQLLPLVCRPDGSRHPGRTHLSPAPTQRARPSAAHRQPLKLPLVQPVDLPRVRHPSMCFGQALENFLQTRGGQLELAEPFQRYPSLARQRREAHDRRGTGTHRL